MADEQELDEFDGVYKDLPGNQAQEEQMNLHQQPTPPAQRSKQSLKQNMSMKPSLKKAKEKQHKGVKTTLLKIEMEKVNALDQVTSSSQTASVDQGYKEANQLQHQEPPVNINMNITAQSG